MQIKEIIQSLEDWAPLAYAEDFDNVGLLVGDQNREAFGVLVTLDTLENVVDEAIENNCNLIVSFHPIIFGGLKKINGNSYVERAVIKAIENKIAIYALHTALDNHFEGVNAEICKRLNLQNRKVLLPQEKTIKKLTTYVPFDDVKKVQQALFAAGAGSIGNYDNCSFLVEGKGTFKGNADSNPVVGERGELREEHEQQINVTFPKHTEKKVLQQLFSAHPYEEVAYEISELQNFNQQIGIGMIGELAEPVAEEAMLEEIKQNFGVGVIRHSTLLQREIKKIAVLGGSGAFAIEAAKRAGADLYLTADLKYHDFYKAEDQLILADIGHYESEQFTKNLIHSYLTKKFPNFAIVLSQKITNPIQYS